MTPEEIKSAIDAAIGAKVLLTYPQLIVFVLMSGIAAYFGAYLKKKGENLATHEDVNSLTLEVEEIKSNFARNVEEYRYDIKVREQAAKVAEYLSLRNSDKNDVYLMNKLSWELALWLPAEVYQHMAHVVVGNPDARKYKEVIIEVRRLLLRDSNDKLTWDNIIHTNWPNKAAVTTVAANPTPIASTAKIQAAPAPPPEKTE
ncbi:MAG TPA: hypothetical protein VGF13_03860 [Verrucomicrobiae bacterium]|jgi:hypothetical protein